MSLKPKIWVVVGTRPEVIKQIPVYWACQQKFGRQAVELVSTGQHTDLLTQGLKHFNEKITIDLAIERSDSHLNTFAGQVLKEMGAQLRQHRPNVVIVQGDTTTAAMVAIAAFYEQIKVAYNEAGLRSYDLLNPFPEEANRRWIAAIANLNFAPTERAKQALLNEAINPNTIEITGNTGIDALMWTLKQTQADQAQTSFMQLIQAQHNSGKKIVFITSHRRENAGQRMENWYQALRTFLDQHPELFYICPIHPNNICRDYAQKYLGQSERVLICDPVDYRESCFVLSKAYFVVTDSGGIQEEAASLQVPAVVCRKTTERREAVDIGYSQLADPDSPESLTKSLHWAYEAKLKNKKAAYPFGTGNSAGLIAELLSTKGMLT